MRCACTKTTVGNVSNVVFTLLLGSTDCIALCMHGNNDPVAAALHIILGDTLRVRPIGSCYPVPAFLSLMAKNLLLKKQVLFIIEIADFCSCGHGERITKKTCGKKKLRSLSFFFDTADFQ